MERGGGGMGVRERWRRLKDRLRFKGVACCGSPWARSHAADIQHCSPFDASTTASQEDAAAAVGPRYRREAAAAARNRRESNQDFGCILDQAPTGDPAAAIEEEEEMNLAMALAAERQLWAAERDVTMTPFMERSSLMRLMDEGGEERQGGGRGGDGGRRRVVGMLRVYGEAEGGGVHPVRAHLLSGAGALDQPGILPALQPVDPRDASGVGPFETLGQSGSSGFSGSGLDRARAGLGYPIGPARTALGQA